MADCKGCGKEMGFADRQNAKNYNGFCQSCSKHEREVSVRMDGETIEQATHKKRQICES